MLVGVHEFSVVQAQCFKHLERSAGPLDKARLWCHSAHSASTSAPEVMPLPMPQVASTTTGRHPYPHPHRYQYTHATQHHGADGR